MNPNLKARLVLFITMASSCFGYAQRSLSLSKGEVLTNMQKIANWQMNEFQTENASISNTDWQNAVLYTGLIALKKIDNGKKCYDFLYNIGQGNYWETGPNRLFADDYCVAQMYTQLYIQSHNSNPRMIAKWKELADTIVAHHFEESLKVVPNINHREWAWCDALFMGPPALAYLTTATRDVKYLIKADTLWWKTSAYLYDKKEHLFYRDSRFFDRREANGQKAFWSRGNGWVMAGAVRMMDNMPGGFKHKKKYIKQFKQMAQRIRNLQQVDGSWHTSLLDPNSFNERETSGTALFCYALAWGVNNHLLSRKEFMPVILKAWQIMVSSIHADGMLGFIQKPGDKAAMTNFNSTASYGVGAFLLAGSEVYKLL